MGQVIENVAADTMLKITSHSNYHFFKLPSKLLPMARFVIILLLFVLHPLLSTSQRGIENIIIITADGLRWQELFLGMDSSIATNKKFNQGDSEYVFKNFWKDSATERRKMLMPFFWSTIFGKGQIVGNRNYDCKVNTVNAYKFSYPGYSEIFTGYADTLINSNEYPNNCLLYTSPSPRDS